MLTMPYGDIDLNELAKLLGLDTRQLERMAQKGEIPTRKVAGNLRFNRTEINQWLKQQMGSMAYNKLSDMDAGITAQRQTGTEDNIVTPLLHPEAICLKLPARTKKSVLKELVLLAEKTQLLYDKDALLETISQREELCSTAQQGGVAIPHPRQPQPYILAAPILVVARASHGIGFGAPDGRLTDLFFMTCSPDDRHHLHILARLCRILHCKNFVDNLRQTTDKQDVVELIKQREQEIINNE
jgi:PTS system nitrogen regulatory IIA component